MERSRKILAQLVDSNELEVLDADELRALLAELDDEVVYGDSEDQLVL